MLINSFFTELPANLSEKLCFNSDRVIDFYFKFFENKILDFVMYIIYFFSAT